SFNEKPENPRSIPGHPEHALASMGVYVFSMDLLVELLHEDHGNDSTHDFGKDILPSMVDSHRVIAYRFGGVSGRGTPDNYRGNVATCHPIPERSCRRGRRGREFAPLSRGHGRGGSTAAVLRCR